MKPLHLALAIATLGFSGCATLDPTERDVLRQHRVSEPVYQRMVRKETLDLSAICELAGKKVPAPFIVRYLRATGQLYRLNTQDVLQLRQAGVSVEVIDYLLATPAMYGPGYADPWYSYAPYFPYYSPRFIVVQGRRR